MATFTLFLGWVPLGDMAPKLLLVLATLFINPRSYTTKAFFFVFLFLVYIGISDTLAGVKFDFVIWLSHNFYFIIPFILSSGLLFKGGQKITYKVAKYSLVVSFLTMLLSIIALIKDPRAIRALSSANSQGMESQMYEYWRQGVADYSMTAMMMFMPGVLFFLSSKENNKKNKKLLLTGSIISFIFILMSQVSTAIILCVFVTLAIKYIKYFEKKIVKFLLVMSILLLSLAPSAISSLTGLAGENDTLEKMGQVGEVASGADIDKTSDTALRFALVGLTIETIAKHPLFGNQKATIGEHNYFLDQLAKYGIIGMSLFFIAIKLQISRIKKLMTLEQWKVYKIIIFFFILFGFIKNMSGMEFWNYFLVFYPSIILYSNSLTQSQIINIINNENSI